MKFWLFTRACNSTRIFNATTPQEYAHIRIYESKIFYEDWYENHQRHSVWNTHRWNFDFLREQVILRRSSTAQESAHIRVYESKWDQITNDTMPHCLNHSQVKFWLSMPQESSYIRISTNQPDHSQNTKGICTYKLFDKSFLLK